MSNQVQEFEWELIWFNVDIEVKRDRGIYATTADEAVRKGYIKYGGTDNAPAKMVSATLIK